VAFSRNSSRSNTSRSATAAAVLLVSDGGGVSPTNPQRCFSVPLQHSVTPLEDDFMREPLFYAQSNGTSREEPTTTAASLPLMSTHSCVRRSGTRSILKDPETRVDSRAAIELTIAFSFSLSFMSAARWQGCKNDGCSIEFYGLIDVSIRDATWGLFAHLRGRHRERGFCAS
jgi:hypothetical protein